MMFTWKWEASFGDAPQFKINVLIQINIQGVLPKAGFFFQRWVKKSIFWQMS